MKLRDALKAGTGLPDVAQMEFNSIPSFHALNALADMGTAGANDVKDKFVDWTWKSASDGDKVYGIPWDSGPMGLLYRDDIFSASGITAPETWDDYAEAALKLAKDKPGTFITTSPPADAGWICGDALAEGLAAVPRRRHRHHHRDQRPERQGLGGLLAEADRRQGGRRRPDLDHRVVRRPRQRQVRLLAHGRLGPGADGLVDEGERRQVARGEDARSGRRASMSPPTGAARPSPR